MLSIEITKDQQKRAKELYKFRKLKNSISVGKTQLYGAIGEIIVHDFYKDRGDNVIFKSTFDYDMIINGAKVDIKTKRTHFDPTELTVLTLAAFNINQACDIYFFVFVSNDKKKGYLAGFSTKKHFFNTAIFKKKGSLYFNDNVLKSDMFCLRVYELQYSTNKYINEIKH